jgi:isoamylase
MTLDGVPSSSFHGTSPWSPDWSEGSCQLAWMFSSDVPSNATEPSGADTVYVIANMAHYASWFDLPQIASGKSWRICFNTADPAGPTFSDQPPLQSQGLLVGERSVVILSL